MAIDQTLSVAFNVFRDLPTQIIPLLAMVAYLPNLFAISTHLTVLPRVSARFVQAIVHFAIRLPTPADTAHIATWMISSFETSTIVL